MAIEIKKQSFKKKLLFLICSIVFTYVFPFLVVSHKFGVFKKGVPISKKITAMGLLLLVTLTFKFSSQLKEFVNKYIKNVWLKKGLTILKNLGIAVVCIVVLENMKKSIANLEFLIVTILVSFTIGNIFLEDFKECLKKDEKWVAKQEMLATLKEFEENKS